MSRSTATAVVSQGPATWDNAKGSVPVPIMYITDKNGVVRGYNTHWTPDRLVKAIALVLVMFAGFVAYGEYRYRFAPSDYWNASLAEGIGGIASDLWHGRPMNSR